MKKNLKKIFQIFLLLIAIILLLSLFETIWNFVERLHFCARFYAVEVCDQPQQDLINYIYLIYIPMNILLLWLSLRYGLRIFKK